MLFLFILAKVACEQASESDAQRTNRNRVTEAKLAIAEQSEGRAYEAREILAKVACEQASESDAQRTNCNRVTEAKLAIAEQALAKRTSIQIRFAICRKAD